MSSDDVMRLEARAAKLAADKSHLQLVIRMMNRIGAAPGLDDTIQSMLQNVLDVIGGQNVALYYQIDQDIFYADVCGKKMKLDQIDDALVKTVFETRTPTECEHDFHDTRMLAPEFTKAHTWVFPLLVGPDLIGIVKMDSLLVDIREWDPHLSTFFNYAALILKNEILGHTRLKKAYDRLETHSRTLEGISLLQRSLLAPAPLEGKLQSITDGIVRLFDADFCRIWLIRPGDRCNASCMHAEVQEGPHFCPNHDRCLHLVTSSGRYTHIDGRGHRRIPIGCYKIGRIASGEEHRFLTNDVQNCPCVHDSRWTRELGLVSFAGYQLRAPDGKTLGVLALFAKHPISADEDAMLDGLGSTAELVIQQTSAEESLRLANEEVKLANTELERALARANELAAEAEAANRAKSVFLASMSHELRTPLNAVLGFSQLMRTDPALNESQKENLDIINRSGTHLLGLINDVLEMSKIEAGRVARKETNFDLWNTLETIEEMVRSRAKAKGLRFILERDPALPRYVRADERKLKQVIINLAGNAVKFTHNGEITLRARAEEGGTILRFEVEDTGPGINAKTIPTMFEPFAQGDQNREGAGLGLFISRKLVEFMGGQITVRSEPDKGSLFSFDIHCESVAAAEIAPENAHRRVASLAPGQRAPRILVAEDTLESRLLMTKTLRSTGFEVVEAENGMESVKLFEECQPDLVLMDMKMPVMDGYEAIRTIRSTRRGKKTPIIAVTASAFEEDRRKILAIGADNVISKPMQAAELFEKIRLLLGIAYIYTEEQADGAEAIDQTGLGEMVAQLPEDVIGELALAMAVLDLDRFKTLLPKVAQHNPLLAEKLGGLANGYRVTELAELFPTTIL